MADKTFNTRIQQKHDIEANWKKAENFIPKIGEIIIYDPDVNYNYSRLKIGDGIKTVSKLPFLIDYFTTGYIDEVTGGCPLPSPSVCYTLRIDETNSNPLTACEYMDDAVGIEKGSSDWDTMPIFNEIKPCTFVNGAVNYYLDPNNFALKADGSAATLDGTDGDVMIEFGKFAYRLYKEGNYQYVSITNDPDLVASDNRFQYYAFSRDTVGDVDKMYIGAFKGWVDTNSKLRSIVNGEKPTGNISLNTGKADALLNGENYNILTYGQLVALQCLFIIKYGNLNSQAVLGKGLTEANESALMGGTIDKGMYYGSATDGTTQIKFAGIEDLWGNVAELCEGFETDSDAANYKITYGNKTIVVSSQLANTYNHGYLSKILGNTEGGFIGVEFEGDEITYYADYSGFDPSKVLFFGGGWDFGAISGLFANGTYFSKDEENLRLGVRLAYI